MAWPAVTSAARYGALRGAVRRVAGLASVLLGLYMWVAIWPRLVG